jgi:hypothetical protein
MRLQGGESHAREGNVAARPGCAGEAGSIGQGERDERPSRLAGETFVTVPTWSAAA